MQTQSSGILEQLKDLQKKLADLDTDIEGDNQEIQKKRAQRAELQAEIAPLTQVVKQMTDSTGALKKEREDGAKLLAETTAYHNKLGAQLKSQLSDEIIAKIEQGVQAIDREIEEAGAAVRTAEEEAAQAGQAHAAAQAAVRATEEQRAATVNELRQLPKAIQGAIAGVKRWYKNLDDTAKAGNLARAYYLILELGVALGGLTTAIDSELEKDLLKQLDEQSETLAEAQETERKAVENVKGKDEALKIARGHHDTLKKQRQQRIDELLSSNEGQTKAQVGQQYSRTVGAAAPPPMPPPIAGSQSS